jgi:hypothetical protein
MADASNPTNINRMEKTMRLDMYTKSVLTIIAISLLMLAVRATFESPKAYASGRPVDVNIVQIAGKDIKTKSYGNVDGALPITNGLDIIGNAVPLVCASR